MSSQISPYQISSPGFLGINLQDSPLSMNPGYALDATNCVIDKSGRLASRNGWSSLNTLNVDLGTATVTCLGELIQGDGTKTILATGNNLLFKFSGSTLTKLTYGGAGVAPVITANNWTFLQLNGIGIFYQRGYDPLIYDPAVSTTTFRRLSEKAASAGTIYQCNIAISAFGRVWAADIATDKNTIVWSGLKTPHIWNSVDAGSIDLTGVWPQGGDEIVALGAHNNALFIFGKKQILIYSGASNPTNLSLSDTISSIGCIARDSIQYTGEDIIFLSSSGVRSLMRTIQEKSAPLRDLSKNIRDELISYTNLEPVDGIKTIYSHSHGFYLLTLPVASVTYCLDIKKTTEDGSARVTKWNNINPTAYLFTSDRKIYIGKTGYIGYYNTSLDNGVTYRISYYTPWIDFGSPVQTSILKKILLTVIGGGFTSVIFKWAFDFNTTYSSISIPLSNNAAVAEYGIAEYGIAEYLGGSATSILKVSAGGSGNVIQFGFESIINGYQLSMQKLDIQTKDGRL